MKVIFWYNIYVHICNITEERFKSSILNFVVIYIFISLLYTHIISTLWQLVAGGGGPKPHGSVLKITPFRCQINPKSKCVIFNCRWFIFNFIIFCFRLTDSDQCLAAHSRRTGSSGRPVIQNNGFITSATSQSSHIHYISNKTCKKNWML